MICRMCLSETVEIMNIFDESGMNLKISSIIAKHFWFEPTNNDPVSTFICNTCWWYVSNFHQYYISVVEAQQKLSQNYLLQSVKEENSDNSECNIVEGGNENGNIQREHDVTFSENRKDEIKLEPSNPFKNLSFEDTSEDHLAGSEINESDGNLMDNVHSDRETNEDLLHEIRKKSHRNTKFTKRILSSRRSSSKRKVKEREKRTIEASSSCEEMTDDKSVLELNSTIDKKGKSKDSTKKGESEYLRRIREGDEKIARYMTLKCDICAEECETFSKIAHHYREMHDRRGYIICCRKKFYKKVFLLDHVNKHINPEYFKCNECNRTFSDNECLKNHNLLWHASDDTKVYKCPECPKKFIKRYQLDQHKGTHVPEEKREHVCNECGKAFSNSNSLYTHKKHIHENANSQMCDICAKVIRGRSLFEKHMLEHSGITEPKVQCKECGVWLKNSSNLRAHMRRHAEAKAGQICPICNKIAPSKQALRGHIKRIHSEVQTFQCNICGKTFKKSISLKEHMSSHTGEVLYTCPHCPKTFNSNANMHSHRKKVHRKEWEENRKRRLAASINNEKEDNGTSRDDPSHLNDVRENNEITINFNNVSNNENSSNAFTNIL